MPLLLFNKLRSDLREVALLDQGHTEQTGPSPSLSEVSTKPSWIQESLLWPVHSSQFPNPPIIFQDTHLHLSGRSRAGRSSIPRGKWTIGSSWPASSFCLEGRNNCAPVRPFPLPPTPNFDVMPAIPYTVMIHWDHRAEQVIPTEFRTQDSKCIKLLIIARGPRYCSDPHCIDGETEAQKESAALLKITHVVSGGAGDRTLTI